MPLPDRSIVRAACLDCHSVFPYAVTKVNCPACGSAWIQAEYDYAALAPALQGGLSGRPFDLWRYAGLLPVRERPGGVSMGEGGTPLIHAPNLGLMLGLPHIYIKDERRGPTASFKDRQAAVNIAALKEAGITEAVLASTGNVAIAYSAYAARAGIKLWAFLTSLVPPEKMREVALYGAQVVKVTATYDQAKALAAEFAGQRGLYLERGARSIPSVEAMKTIAFEAAEQLAAQPGLPADARQCSPGWRAPDWYFQAISGGLGPLGVIKGFTELRTMGLCDHLPALGGIQTEGCAPMASAWRAGADTAAAVRSPRTHITTLSTGDPGRTYTLLRAHMLAGGGGLFESVSDADAFRAMHVLAKMEGISVEPAAAVAFAGLIKLARAGALAPDQVIVVNCSGHTMAIESELLGEGWVRSVAVQAEAANSQGEATEVEAASRSAPQEGLLAALSQATPSRFARVAIIDDTPDARRLVRRILQAQGEYTLFEADNGRAGLELIRCERPDLVILDLMMPEMDGFAVLDALKADPLTAPIPVIVVTAKELTPAEKARLSGQANGWMQKGEFLNDDLAGEVQSLIHPLN